MTPTLSVEAVQESETLDEVWLGEVRFVGVEGGVVSPLAAEVVTLTVLEAADTFPAASTAFTVKLYDVEAARPVFVKLVEVDVPTCAPFRKISVAGDADVVGRGPPRERHGRGGVGR